VDVDVPSSAVMRPREELFSSSEMYRYFLRDGRLKLRNVTVDPAVPILPVFYWTTNHKWSGLDLRADFERCESGSLERIRRMTCNFLVAVLASRNVVKTVKHSKAAKLGIGKNRYEYTTTLSVPTQLENDPDHAPTGRTVCPHLRRGHIRRQHYGPNRELIKQVWIAPVFVNADERFVNSRKAYNMRGNCDADRQHAEAA
jgi:hypothetical protein